MKVRLFLLLNFLIVFPFMSLSYGNDEKILIAIRDLAANQIEPNSALTLTERMRIEFQNKNNFTCMGRIQMQKILVENGYSDSIWTSEDPAIAIGKILAVQYFLDGTISKIGELYSLHLRIFDIEQGSQFFTVDKDCSCPIESFYSNTLKEVVENAAKSIIESRYANLNVSSTPPGAQILLNNSKKGVTPCSINKIYPGTFELKIEMDTYETVQKTIELKRGATEELQFTLSHTQHYNDSLRRTDSLNAVKTALQNAQKQKRIKRFKIVSRVALSTLAAAMAGGGYYLDTQIKDVMTEKQQLYNSYIASNNIAEINRYRTEYYAKHEDGQTLVKQRNLLYVGAGLTGVCFGVTFFFK